MFSNLRNVLHRKGITIRQYAEFLGLNEKTVQNKIRGVTEFTLSELRKTCKLLLPEYNPDFLFAIDPSEASI